jgi:hypothetical protein
MDLIEIANKKFGPLTDSESGLLHAAVYGELFWCGGSKEYWDPSNDPENGAHWSSNRTVRASLIEWLVRDPLTGKYINPNGIRIAGARIEGYLDLSHLLLRWPLGLPRCFIPSGLTLFFTRAMNLDLAGCWTGPIKATRLVVEGSLLLGAASRVSGELDLADATIEGDLDCAGGSFLNPSDSAIRAVGLKVNGSVMLGTRSRPADGGVDAFRSSGEVNFTGAQIGGDLDCEGGRFRAPSGKNALAAKAIRVSGSVLMRARRWQGRRVDFFLAYGEVTLEDAQIGAALDCSGGHFINRNATALNFNGGKVEGNLFLNQGFHALGEVNLVGARIGSFLECAGGRFINLNAAERKLAQLAGSALTAEGATIGGSMQMIADNEGRIFQARGMVSLAGAQIGGYLNCVGGRFLDGDTALRIDGSTVRGNVMFGSDNANRPFIACGTVSLVGTEIRGRLNCTGGCFLTGGSPDNLGKPTIDAALARVDGHVFFDEGFVTDGFVNFNYAEIGGLLSFEQAGFARNVPNGLVAREASVKGDLVWRPSESSILVRPSLSRRLRTFTGSLIKRPLPPSPTSLLAQYQLDLGHTSVGRLKDDSAKWPSPGNLKVAGFVYGAFHVDSDFNVSKRLEWLTRQEGYRPQPYRQLAKVLREAGLEEDAIKVEIANEKALRASGHLTRRSWFWKWILQVTIGCGYRPLRALWYVAGFVLFGTFLFNWGYRAGVITPTDSHAFDAFSRYGAPPEYYGDFSPFIYSLGTFLPLVDFYQSKQWGPNPEVKPTCTEPLSILESLPVSDRLSKVCSTKLYQNFGTALRYYLWVHIMMGWFFTTLFVAGLTGLVRGKE